MINLKPATADRRNFYGLLFESEATYTIAGRGVHNSGSEHKIQVWISKRSQRRDDIELYGENHQIYRDCNGEISKRGALLVTTSAQSTMISSTPVDRDPRGGSLVIGGVVDLGIFGLFQLTVKSLHDPILVPVEAE
jgi:hypothetical protein